MAKRHEKDHPISRHTPDRRIDAPELPYQPRDPKKSLKVRIGLIGCGGITQTHLTAYRSAGYRVTALCDVDEAAARRRQERFYPKADVYTKYRDLLKRDDVNVVDVATHPEPREKILADALKAGKHVLSQKPFVLDLAVGQKLVRSAKRRKLKLAVNQNGRWAPHFSYIRHAIAEGLLGEVMAVHLSVHWNHNWVKRTAFNDIRHVVLYDFGIHWFDILTCFMGERKPKKVYASFARSPSQEADPPLLAQATVEYDGAQASVVFDADTRYGPQDRTYVAGSEGTIVSIGPNLDSQVVMLFTEQGQARPVLRGSWFPDGFHGTMGELLRAIGEDREPENGAAGNLDSLALCFAAIASAEAGKPVKPGSITKLPQPKGRSRK